MTLISLINKRVAELDAKHIIDASRENNVTVKSNISQLKIFSALALSSISDAISVLNYVRLVDPDSDICKNTLTNINNLKDRIGDFPDSFSSLLNTNIRNVTNSAKSDLENLKREIGNLWKAFLNNKLDQLSFSLLDLFDLIPELETYKSQVQILKSRIAELRQIETPKEVHINSCKDCLIDVNKLVNLLNDKLDKPLQEFLIKLTSRQAVLTDLVNNQDLLKHLIQLKLTDRLILEMKPPEIIQPSVVHPWRRISR